jgi:hypothetical protein
MLGTLVVLEHVGLLWWGAVWPWRNSAAYPGDSGMNDYLILATCLLVAVSLSGAAAYRLFVRPLPLLIAMAVVLPLGVFVLLVLLSTVFLDPVVEYLALLPSVAAVIAPYAIAARFCPSHLRIQRSMIGRFGGFLSLRRRP